MKKIELLSLSKIESKKFAYKDFVEKEKSSCANRKITKKALKKLAEQLGLEYNNEQIEFTKKVMLAYKEMI